MDTVYIILASFRKPIVLNMFEYDGIHIICKLIFKHVDRKVPFIHVFVEEFREKVQYLKNNTRDHANKNHFDNVFVEESRKSYNISAFPMIANSEGSCPKKIEKSVFRK
ncbi:hypothetical protein ACJX0J_006286 [Zea mays]